jgi:glucan phosphorylase
MKVAEWLQRTYSMDVNPEFLFDVQIKRIHEYKRQLLAAMHAIALAHRISDGDDSIVPRTIIFGGKAAPGYAMAKLIIRLIHSVAAFVRSNRRTADRLNIVFVPNYDVSSAELLFPATEISEQISTAGTEASGTGCMKAVMNYGAIVDALVSRDRYFHCIDFAPYFETQERAADAWLQRDDWARRSIFNTARSGPFSSDRTVAEYARDIWGVKAVPVSLDAPR